MAKTIVKVYQGGTGAETASAARTALGALSSGDDAFERDQSWAADAVPRSVLAKGSLTVLDPPGKLMDVISVADFGAYGGGAVDESDKVQAALDALLAMDDGGTLVFPMGKYRLDSPITLIADSDKSSKSWVIEGGGATLLFVYAPVDSGSLFKVGSTNYAYRQKSFISIRNLRIEGPETANATRNTEGTPDSVDGNTVGLHISKALNVVLDTIYIRRCYKGLLTDDVWPITATAVEAAACYIGIHLDEGSNLGQWLGCAGTANSYSLLIYPSADGTSIGNQVFIGHRCENSQRGITIDQNDTSGNSVRDITFIAPRLEAIRYDLLRMGKVWTFDDPQLDTTSRSGRYLDNVTVHGGDWPPPWAIANPDSPGSQDDPYIIRSSNNLYVRGCDLVLPVGNYQDEATNPALIGDFSKSRIYISSAHHDGTNEEVGDIFFNGCKLQIEDGDAGGNLIHCKSTISNDHLFFVQQDATGNASLGLYKDSGSAGVKLNVDGDSYFTGGDLGVGTNNPTNPLHVIGKVYSTTTVQGGTALIKTSNGFATFGSNSTGEPIAIVIDGDASGDEGIFIATTGRVTVKKASNNEFATTITTSGSAIAIDLDDADNFNVTLNATADMSNPTNITVGQSGCIVITHGSTMTDISGWGSYWHFEEGTAPTLSEDAVVDNLVYFVASATSIHAVLLKDMS